LKRSYGPVECEAYCETCGWSTESYKNGQAIAAIHAKKHGHKVNGHVINSFTYDGTKENTTP
jgi:hypothetical protein